MRYYGVQNEVKAYLNRLQSENGIETSPSTIKTLNDRVESLKKSGVWSQYSLGFNDVDADSYFQRASVNDVIGRSEVCWFVRGMKSLGLWQNMVSWPLRSYQNAGTGSTVFSLGGLGVFNGTMFNSPAWGISGITFTNASSQRISFGSSQIIEGNSNYTMMGVAQLINIATPLLTVIGMGNQRGVHFRAESGGSTQARFTGHDVTGVGWPVVYVNGPTTSMFAGIAAGNSTNLRLFMNSGIPFNTQALDARTNPSSLLVESIGAFNNTGASFFNFFNGIIATGILWDIALTNNQVTSFYNLYKSTLGSDLGLP